MNKLYLPALLALLIFGFYQSRDFQQVAAGVAIFLFGMRMLQEGFEQFAGGLMQRILGRATNTLPKAIGFGIVTTTITQSSSLISVITISFLSAGLISLAAGVGIIFGANLGTTTGAWLIAGFGLKVDISAYAMPMLALAIVLVFQKNRSLRGAGFLLAGLGFLFLGIFYMKTGFETFKDGFDLTRYAMTGLRGLVVYTLVGAIATAVMQSSHATMVLVITALAAGQVSYENAIALAIGSNIGTTITAGIASLSASFQGRRLALAHLVFNLVTAAIALVFIGQFVWAVDAISNAVGIAAGDFALKLAVFHSLFNLVGIAVMVPLVPRLLTLLERAIPEPAADVSKPRYLAEAVDAFPASMVRALRLEVGHLQKNAIMLIAQGLNLSLDALYASDNVRATVVSSHKPLEIDMDDAYERKVKTLYSAIVEFATRAASKPQPEGDIERINALLAAAQRLVESVKAVKHMRRNVTRFTATSGNAASSLYNGLRTGISRILVEVHDLEQSDPEVRSSLWLDDARVQVHRDRKNATQLVESMIREQTIDADTATSFLNDSSYAYLAMEDLIEAARIYYIETEGALAEVERILALGEEEVEERAAQQG